MEIANKRLKSALSHFMSKRDKCVAELDLLLNAYSGEIQMESIYETFERLAVANMAIDNIKLIVADNNDQPDYSQLDEINRMADAIQQKLKISDGNQEIEKQE